MKRTKQIFIVLFMIPFVTSELIVSAIVTIAVFIWTMVFKNGITRSEKWVQSIADYLLNGLNKK